MTKPRPRWFRRHPRTAIALVVLFGTVALDVGTAATLSACGLWESPRHPDTYYRSWHPVYHHSLKPNNSFDGARWGNLIYPVRTNSLGFRDREVREVPLQGDQYRLVLIGDSFTEGLALPWEDTFAGMLAERLAPRGVEVLNAGVVSYAPSVYLKKVTYLIENVKLRFDHLVVFIDLSDIQDEYRNYKIEPESGSVVNKRPEGLDDILKRFVADHTILMNAASTWIRHLRKRDENIDDQIGERRCLWTIDPDLFEEYGRAGLAAATDRMDELAAFLGARDIQLTVAVYPWPDQIEHRDLESKQVVHWRTWAERHGAGFIDCFPAFIDERPAREVIAADFIPGDVHMNRAGNAAIADCVMSVLGSKLPR